MRLLEQQAQKIAGLLAVEGTIFGDEPKTLTYFVEKVVNGSGDDWQEMTDPASDLRLYLSYRHTDGQTALNLCEAHPLSAAGITPERMEKLAHLNREMDTIIFPR